MEISSYLQVVRNNERAYLLELEAISIISILCINPISATRGVAVRVRMKNASRNRMCFMTWKKEKSARMMRSRGIEL
jgi:hypothetical protein